MRESNGGRVPWALFLSELIGTALACSFLAKRIEVAKLYHFDSDRDRLFRRMAESR
jgi:hypothetical protein